MCCTCGLTLRRVRCAMQWKSNEYHTTCVSVFPALVIQHEMRMRHVVICGPPRPALQYFPTLSHKQHDFRGEKIIQHKNAWFEILYCPSNSFDYINCGVIKNTLKM